jgi:hypothetical protein
METSRWLAKSRAGFPRIFGETAHSYFCTDHFGDRPHKTHRYADGKHW